MSKLGMTLRDAMMADPTNLNAGFAPGPAAAPQPQGFFKPGGMGRTLAGTIGDFLLQQAHMAPVYAPAMQQRQQAEQEEVKWQRNRTADNEDWQNRQAWQLAHPAPHQPTAFEDNAGNRWVTDPVTGENRMVFVDKAPKQIIQDGQVITIQNPYLNGGAAPAHPPITEDLWNRGTPVGGQASAPGGFPRF